MPPLASCQAGCADHEATYASYGTAHIQRKTHVDCNSVIGIRWHVWCGRMMSAAFHSCPLLHHTIACAGARRCVGLGLQCVAATACTGLVCCPSAVHAAAQRYAEAGACTGTQGGRMALSCVDSAQHTCCRRCCWLGVGSGDGQQLTCACPRTVCHRRYLTQMSGCGSCARCC